MVEAIFAVRKQVEKKERGQKVRGKEKRPVDTYLFTEAISYSFTL